MFITPSSFELESQRRRKKQKPKPLPLSSVAWMKARNLNNFKYSSGISIKDNILETTQIDQLKRIFGIFDATGDGNIDISELEDALLTYGYTKNRANEYLKIFSSCKFFFCFYYNICIISIIMFYFIRSSIIFLFFCFAVPSVPHQVSLFFLTNTCYSFLLFLFFCSTKCTR